MRHGTTGMVDRERVSIPAGRALGQERMADSGS